MPSLMMSNQYKLERAEYKHDSSKTCTPVLRGGGAVLTYCSGIERLAGSSGFLVLLVVVDLGELRVDHIILLGFG
jgi:hypothetical protein